MSRKITEVKQPGATVSTWMGDHSSVEVDAVVKNTRAGNLLIRSSLIRSFRSNQMSNCEQFAQIAQDK